MNSARPWAAVAALLGSTAVGFAVRAWGTTRGYLSDEFANLYGGPWWGAFSDPEAAVNPPLLRAMVNLLWDDATLLPAGRVAGVVASTAALPVLWLLTARVAPTRTWVAAWVATTVWALHPATFRAAATVRSYPYSHLFGALFFLALLRWWEGGRGALWVALLAVALVWTHYLWIPVLAGLGLVGLLSKRPTASLLFLPAALSVAPMAPLVFSDTSTRVAAASDWDNLRLLLGLGLRVPVAWAGDRVVVMVVVVVAALTGIGARFRALTLGERLLGAATLVQVVAVWLVGQVQVVRPPVAGLWAITALPLLASAAARSRWTLFLPMLLLANVVEDLREWRDVDLDAGPRRFAASHADFGVVPGDVVHVVGGAFYSGLYWYLTGDHIMNARDEGDGVRAGELTLRRGDNPEAPGVHVAFAWSAALTPPACEALHGSPGLWVWRCR